MKKSINEDVNSIQKQTMVLWASFSELKEIPAGVRSELRRRSRQLMKDALKLRKKVSGI